MEMNSIFAWILIIKAPIKSFYITSENYEEMFVTAYNLMVNITLHAYYMNNHGITVNNCNELDGLNIESKGRFG